MSRNKISESMFDDSAIDMQYDPIYMIISVFNELRKSILEDNTQTGFAEIRSLASDAFVALNKSNLAKAVASSNDTLEMLYVISDELSGSWDDLLFPAVAQNCKEIAYDLSDSPEDNNLRNVLADCVGELGEISNWFKDNDNRKVVDTFSNIIREHDTDTIFGFCRSLEMSIPMTLKIKHLDSATGLGVSDQDVL